MLVDDYAQYSNEKTDVVVVSPSGSDEPEPAPSATDRTFLSCCPFRVYTCFSLSADLPVLVTLADSKREQSWCETLRPNISHDQTSFVIAGLGVLWNNLHFEIPMFGNMADRGLQPCLRCSNDGASPPQKPRPRDP